MAEAPVARLAAVIRELARAHASTSPAPPGLPFLGLEHPSGTGFHLLERLSTRGIFRKYESVLELGAGLGGRSRWLAARLGCEVVGTSAVRAEAAAAATLTRRAGLAAHVRAVVSEPNALPFRNARFTHVWILEALPCFPEAEAALAEAHRVLRPGGLLAVQDLLRDPTTSVVVPGWRFGEEELRAATLRRAGFVDVQMRDVSAEAAERSARVQAARDELLRRLRILAAGDRRLDALVAEREALARGLGSGALRVVQFLAHRQA